MTLIQIEHHRKAWRESAELQQQTLLIFRMATIAYASRLTDNVVLTNA
ncbi:MAG: hypothetical protein ACLQSR_16540 [Limisphaerales bacterium]